MAKNRRAQERRAQREAAGIPATAPSSPDAPPAPPTPPRRRAAGPSALEALFSRPWVLPAVLLAAALLRVAHVVALSHTPFFDRLELDPLVYDEWAQRIAAGDWMGSRVFYQDPLYPYFLGVLYAVFGRSLWLVYLLQAAFGVATCWLTGLLGRRIFGQAAGNLAALMAALFLPSIFYEVQVEKTFLSVFLVTAFLVLVFDRRAAARAGAGAALALACLTRANLIVFVPLVLATLLFERVAEGRRECRYDFLRAPGEWGLRQAAAFVAGCFVVLAPVAVRNHHVEGQWVLTTSQAGQNFYIGNNPLNTTGSYIVPPSIRPDPRFEEMDFRAEAEKQAGRALKPSEVSAFWTAEAWKHIASDPTFAQMMFLRKFLLFWNDYEVPDNLNMYLMERWSWVLALPIPGLGLLTALAVLGAVAGFAARAEVRALVAFVAVYCATVVAFFVFSRYRIQVAPVLMVLGAHGLLWLEAEVRASRWDRAAGGAAAVALAAFFCFQRFEWTDRDKAIAVSLNNLGAMYAGMGDMPKAIEAYEEAVRLKPEGVVAAIRVLGEYYLRAGDLDRAEQYMRQVVTLKPDSRMGWNALAELYGRRVASGDGDPTLGDRQVAALLSAGRPEDARRAAEAATQRGLPPSDEIARRLQAGR